MFAIVAALEEEIKGYVRKGKFRLDLRDGGRRFYLSSSYSGIVVVVGGVGRRKAQEATEQLIKRYGPDLIVSTGFAGGTLACLSSGDLVICDRFLCLEGSASTWKASVVKEQRISNPGSVKRVVSNKWPVQKYRLGGCLSAPFVVSDRSLKEWIGTTFPVSVVDMESYWVNETAAEHGIDHVGVRAVLDPVGESLPAFAVDSVGYAGVRRVVRGIGTLVSRPRELPGLFGLAMKASMARSSLESFLVEMTLGQPKG